MESYFKKRFNEFNSLNLRDQSDSDSEQQFYMPSSAEYEVYDRPSGYQSDKWYRNASSSRNTHRSLKNKPQSSKRNGDIHNGANASSYAMTYTEYFDKCSTPTNIHSRNASVQVSPEYFQRFRTENDYHWCNNHSNLNNFIKNEDILDTCKYCKKPLSASDFELDENNVIYHPLQRGPGVDFINMDSKCSESCCPSSSKSGSKSISVKQVNMCDMNHRDSPNSFKARPKIFFHGPYYSYNLRVPLYSKERYPKVHPERNVSYRPYHELVKESYRENSIPYINEYFNPCFNNAPFIEELQCFCDRCSGVHKRRRQAFENTYEHQTFSEPNMHRYENPNCEYSDLHDYGCHYKKQSCKQAICKNKASLSHTSSSFSPRHYSPNDSRRKWKSERNVHQGKESDLDEEPNCKSNTYLLCIDENPQMKRNSAKSNSNHSYDISSNRNHNVVSKPGRSLSKCTCEMTPSSVKSVEEKTSNRINSLETIDNSPPSIQKCQRFYESSPKENLKEGTPMKQKDEVRFPRKVASNENIKYSIEDVCKLAFRCNEDSDQSYEISKPGFLNSHLLNKIKKGSKKNPIVLIVEADRGDIKLHELQKHSTQNHLEKLITALDQSTPQHPQIKPTPQRRSDEPSLNISNLDSSMAKERENSSTTQSNKSNFQVKNIANNIKNTTLNKSLKSNVQRRFKNPEVQDNVYSKADNVLREMKEVLQRNGKWSGI